MNEDQAKSLGQFLRRRRQELGLSKRQLAALARMRDSTIVRIERGEFIAPRPDKLARIATALHLSLADVFARAAYFVPDELPSFGTYLRAKYPELPVPAAAEMSLHFTELQQRHGLPVDLTEPSIRKRDNDPTRGTP
jgi:transcriptional regulator with XRE-family HTH domain